MKKRIIGVVMVLLMVSVFALGCSNESASDDQGDQSLEKIKEEGVFVVGLDDAFAPMGFRDNNGDITGFDVDLAKEAIERLGVEIELQPIDWNSKELSLNNGDIDVIWNGLTITPEREEKILFSKPYLANDQIVAVQGDSAIATKADLEGKIVGVQMGSSSYKALENDTEVFESLQEVKQYDTNDTALLDLAAGRVDAVVVDEILGRYYISKKPNEYKVLEENFGSEEYGIGFRLEDEALRNEIDRIMDEMKEDGTTAEISQEWFGEDIVLK